MKSFHHLTVLLLFCIIFSVSTSDEDRFKCVRGVNYEENKCNSCQCFRNDLVCTLMACESHLDAKLTGCEVGSSWTEGCEQCWCVEKLGTLCTLDCGKVHKQSVHGLS